MAIGKIAAPVTELNFNLVWAQLPESVRLAYIGSGQKVKLPPGFRLYKYTEYGLAGRGGKITEWWSPVDAYGIDAGLRARQSLATRMGTTAADLTRVVAAVKENWNALTFLLQATLTQPVYGFWCQCATQRRLDDGSAARAGTQQGRTRNLPGYAWQLYIPNLTPRHIVEASRVPA